MPRTAKPQSLKPTHRRLLPRRPNPAAAAAPPAPAPTPKAPEPQTPSAAAHLRAADDQYLRLSLAALAKIRGQLQRVEATLAPHSQRLPPVGALRDAIPAYTVRGLGRGGAGRGGEAGTLSAAAVEADYALPGMLATARSRGAVVQKNLEDLLAQPYPATKGLGEGREGGEGGGGGVRRDVGVTAAAAATPSPGGRGGTEAAAVAAGTHWNDPGMAGLMGSGMGEFRRRVAGMSVAEKEDALLTLQMHAAGVRNRLEVRSKRLLASAQRLQGATAEVDDDDALIETGPTFSVTDEARTEDAEWDRGEDAEYDQQESRPAGTNDTATSSEESDAEKKPQLEGQDSTDAGSGLRAMQRRLQLATGSRPSTRK